MQVKLGIDIGGTKANIGLFSTEGVLLGQTKIKMTPGVDERTALRVIMPEAESLLHKHNLTFSNVTFAGIGVPGTVDESGRIVRHAPNLGWRDVPCARIVRDLCGVYPLLVQDSRAAALGEYFFGAGQGSRLLICVTLGTGIGCGILVNGALLGGALGTAGEIGHIPVVPGGRPCGCGRFGCAETYGSGTGIARSAAEHPAFVNKHLSSEDVFALAAAGNRDAQSLLDDAIQKLGQALVAVVNTLSPDALIFSGGMCAQKQLFIDPLARYIRQTGYSLAINDSLRISVARLGSDAPMIGAAMLDRAL